MNNYYIKIMSGKSPTLLDRVKKAYKFIADSFDKLPTPVKVIMYFGTSAYLVQIQDDITGIELTNEYASITLGIVINIIEWLLLNLHTVIGDLRDE